MAHPGLFITFEGPEGSGKSSQANALVQALRRHGHAVTQLRDPGSTRIGKALRQALLHTTAALPPLAEALLFIGGRVRLVEERIVPALSSGRMVVCDRFHDSTVAYQGFGGQVDARWLDEHGQRMIKRVMPALTLLLDLPAAVGLSRLKGRPDRIEANALSFHRRVRRGYLCLAKRYPNRIVVIDGTQSPERVRQEIWDAVQPHVR
jgi:dTMP kinase